MYGGGRGALPLGRDLIKPYGEKKSHKNLATCIRVRGIDW